METVIMIGQLILGLSIIVGLHELGHLLTAKLFGMRVERFSIGFPPRIFGIKWGETTYEIGALPLGGFVKISGMIDESFDTTHLKEEPKEYEFRSKPAWQRLIVMMGGIVINVITGIMMFIGVVYYWGDSYIPADEVKKHGIVAYELGEKVGLKTGDRIIDVNGKSYDKFYDLLSPEVLLGSDAYYTIERDGERKKIMLPNDLVEKISDRKNPQRFFWVMQTFSVGEVLPDSPASKAGLKAGDVIVSFNGKPIEFFHEFQALQEKNKNKPVKIQVKRGEKIVPLTITSDKEGKFGFQAKDNIETKNTEYSLGEATSLGASRAFMSVVYNIQGFGKLFRQEVSTKALSGPIGIAQIFGTTWVWLDFWRIVAILSMWLAFLNFLPIPALDGGHVMFLTYEIISGRKPSDRFLQNAQTVGVIILLALMVFVIFNDIFNIFIR